MAEKAPDSVSQVEYFGGVLTNAEKYEDDGVKLNDAKGKKLYFAKYVTENIDDGDEWTSGLTGITAVAWQSNTVGSGAEASAPYLKTAATGVIGFENAAANAEGWLWILAD